MKNKDQLKSILRQYKVPKLDENQMVETIRLGQQHIEKTFPSRTTYYTLFKTQFRFVTPYLWLVQLLIVMLFIMFFINVVNPLDEIPKVIYLLSITFSLTTVPEIMKSEMYGMSVFEQTSKHGFIKIVLTRAIIINAINIMTLSIILIFISVHYQMPFLQLILYGLVPMNIVNGLSLLCIDVFNVRSKTMLMGIYLSLFVTNYAIVNSKLFLSLSYLSWFIIFIISSIFILIEMYVFIAKMKNKERFQWN